MWAFAVWGLLSFDLADGCLILSDAGFDVLDGDTNFFEHRWIRIRTYMNDVSACGPVDESAIAFAGEDSNGDCVLAAVDEKRSRHSCGSLVDLGARGNTTTFSDPPAFRSG